MKTYSHGGYHRFEIHDRVKWSGQEGKVIALTVCPSVTVEFDNGERLTVGQDVLAYVDDYCAHCFRQGEQCARRRCCKSCTHRRKRND